VYAGDIREFVDHVSAAVAVAVESGINREQAQRLELELRDERDHLRFILDVNNLLVSQLDYRALLEAICETVQRVVDADRIGVALYDQESRQLRADVIYDRAGTFATASGEALPLAESAAGVTFERGVWLDAEGRRTGNDSPRAQVVRRRDRRDRRCRGTSWHQADHPAVENAQAWDYAAVLLNKSHTSCNSARCPSCSAWRSCRATRSSANSNR
jgi:hypothetical protein